MGLTELLEIQPGITAVIGGGGKTSLLRVLGQELAAKYRVVLCTTTKIYPYPDLPCARTAAELDELAVRYQLLCTGTEAPGGKLTVPPVSMGQLLERFAAVLVEADGSAGKPLKAHAPYEPVIPPQTQRRILVVGASGVGCSVAEAAHRPERYAHLAGVEQTQRVTPDLEAMVIQSEGLHDLVFVNQVETPGAMAAAQALAQRLDCPVVAGSLRLGIFHRLR